MVFMGLGRFSRSTPTHHSLCWGKAGKRMQKKIFFAFRFITRPPLESLRFTRGGGGGGEAQKRYIMLHLLFAKQTKCGAPERESLKVVNCAHLASRYVYTSPQATLMNHPKLFLSLMSFARRNIFWLGHSIV
uniref:Uncharacterized protein n=1 Tax=Treubia lacunosa TaxID=93845 RepID=G4Y9S1_9MARC|nr:hypothetical protein TrlaMp22 [Treubia lacunosa]AEH99717.1 hypothetical protein TrlaMp22 [Treubia lacunosa]